MLTSTVGLVLTVIVLIGIYWYLFGSSNGRSRRSSKTTRLRALLDSTFLAGLISSVALGALVHDSAQGQAGGWLTGLLCGAGTASLFAMLSFGGRWNEDGLFTQLLSAVFGVVGLIVTISSFFAPSGVCTPADIGQRVLGFALVGVAFMAGGALSWTRGLFAPHRGGPAILAVFGAFQVVDILVFLSSPLGVTLTTLGISGWAVSLIAALGLGFAASIWPQFVLSIAGIATAAGALYGGLSGAQNSLCTPGTTDASSIAPILGYVAVYVVVKGVVGGITGATASAGESEKENASA